MSVVTVLCHGTGRSQVSAEHEKSGELISWLGNHLAGAQAKTGQANVEYSSQTRASTYTAGSYIINEGPGHKEEEGALLPQNFSAEGKITRRAGHEGSDRLLGNIRGTGWTTNVDRTMAILTSMARPAGVTTVNLCGWSRGAVTCIRIANRMKDDPVTAGIACNIFAVDPVAGAGSSKKEGVERLRENVEAYIACLAMHERRSWFKPQDFSRLSVIDPNVTKVCMLPFPGLHSTLVTIKEPKQTAEIIRTLAVEFLQDHGTNFDESDFQGKAYSSKEMCEKYAQLIDYLSPGEGAQWQTPKSTGGGGTIKRRSFNTHSKMDLYTHGGKGSYWINEHHEQCFKDAYPAVYRGITTGNSTNKGEIEKLNAPGSQKTFATLLDKALIEVAGAGYKYHGTIVSAMQTKNNFTPGSAGFPLC